MAWPQSQDYNEAIQNAKSCFKDPELSKGQAVTNPLGMPLPCSGNFADVYQVRCPETNSRWAVKCFTRGDPAALAQRYAKIDEHLQKVKLPFTVGFRFLEEGIRIRNQWHPVLKMQWVEGFTLNQFVRDNLDKPNLLEALLQIWVRMAKRLREADMAHADLQHGNVLLVPGSTANALRVKLIDYDGMWVPALAGQQSGEVGHPAYQHSQRLREGTYSKEVDRFPLLVVATALRCLRVGGRPLWEKFDNGDNLLFREADLAAPVRSPLFAELVRIQDPQAQKLVDALRQACRQPLEEAPFLDALLPEAAPAPKSVPVAAVLAPQPAPIPIGVPAPAAIFSDIGGEPAGPSGHRRRDGKPFWKKGAIAGGIAAVFLTTVLVIALSGGDKNKPDPPPGTNPEVAHKDNSKDTKQTDRASGTKKTDRVPVAQLSLAELPELQLDPGAFKQFDIQVNGVNGAAGFTVELPDLPKGVRSKRESINARTGKTVWVLTVDADVAGGERHLTVIASAGAAQAQGRLRLVVTELKPDAAGNDRKAAEWVLLIDGTIRIKENGVERQTRAVGDLPRGAFELTFVELSNNPKVSDAGLVHFKDCKNLTILLLGRTKVSDVGLAHFKDCKNLRQLNLFATEVSDAGLAHFKDCKNLEILELNNTKVSDVGLAHFKDCKNLRHLHLSNTRVGDAGLAHFKDCKNLTWLVLNDTKASAAGVAELQKALPKCKIEPKKDPDPPIVAERKKGAAAYDGFPEPFRSQLVKEWESELGALKRATKGDEERLNRAKTVKDRQHFTRLISDYKVKLAKHELNNPPYFTKEAEQTLKRMK